MRRSRARSLNRGDVCVLPRPVRRLLAFLYGWCTFIVYQTGSIAAIAVAFARYFGYFVHSPPEHGTQAWKFLSSATSPRWRHRVKMVASGDLTWRRELHGHGRLSVILHRPVAAMPHIVFGWPGRSVAFFLSGPRHGISRLSDACATLVYDG